MTDKVFYEELLPHEFIERISHKPIGYIPIGTLEWHGVQNALGADCIQACGLFERVAKISGGIVFPAVWIGPDRIFNINSKDCLIGMDTDDSTKPNQQLPGSCYWISKGLFIILLESIISQAKRAGFKCLIADGHGPSRIAWSEMADTWEKQFNIKLISAIRDFPDNEWKTQNDHAGKNETSAMLALRPDLVDLSQLPKDKSIIPKGIIGLDPRDSNADYGETLINDTVQAIVRKLSELGF